MSKRILSFISVIALLMMTFSGGFASLAAVGDNLITNGDFENAKTGWTGSSALVMTTGGNTNASGTATNCAYIWPSNLVVSQTVNLNANTYYKLSAAIKGSNTAQTALVGVKDPSGNAVPGGLISTNKLDGYYWVYYTMFYTGAVSGSYTVYLTGVLTDKSVNYDDIRLIEIGTTANPNMVENSSFEQGIYGNGMAGWKETATGVYKTTTTPAEVYSGTTAAYLYSDGQDKGVQNIVLLKDHTYKLKAAIRIPTGSSGQTAKVAFRTLASVDVASTIITATTANSTYAVYEKTFTVTTEAAYQLYFSATPNSKTKPIQYDDIQLYDMGTGAIDVTVTAGTGGTASGTSKYNQGDTVTISATPSAGYNFTSWTVLSGGVTLANENSATTTFTMPSNAVSVQANFTQKPYAVTIGATSEGTITGNTYYNAGDTVTVKAVPNTGYVFSKWVVLSGTVTLANFENIQTSFTMPSGNVELKPVFKSNMILNGDFENAANGSFTIPSWTTSNIMARNDYVGYKSYGMQANLYNNVNANGYQAVTTVIGTSYRVGAYVMGYNGTASDVTIYACTGTASATPTDVVGSAHASASTWTYIYFDFVATATSTKIGFYNDGKWAGIDRIRMTETPYTLAVNTTAGGSVVGADGYLPGETVYLAETASPGYTFTSWEVASGGIELATVNTYKSFVMPSNDVTVNANFTPKAHAFTVPAVTGGSVSGNAPYYDAGETVLVTANASNGYIFSHWTATGITLANPENIEQTFAMPAESVSMTPVFKKNMIVNGDFEAGTLASWTTNKFSNNSDTVTASKTNAGYKSYGYLASIGAAQSPVQPYAYQSVTVVPGATYRVSAYVEGFAEASDITLFVCAGAASATPVDVIASNHAVADSFTWTSVTFDFVAPAGVTSVNVGFYNDGKAAGVDKVTMQKIAASFGSYAVSASKILTKLLPGTTIDAFLNAADKVDAEYVVTNSIGSLNVGTGTTIQVATNGEVNVYTALIYGDVTGDGAIDVSDLAALKRQLLGDNNLSGSTLAAGDIFNKGKITISDLIAVKKQVLDLYSISQG